MGYHPGAEDDAMYLAAVKSAVMPSLYSFDSPFFKFQLRTSVFDVSMAHFVRASGLSVSWSEFLWQFVSILVLLYACWSILSTLFEETTARWGGMAMVSAMLTLPVAGTGLYLADQYLHPRNLATALILLAVARILANRGWQALPLLLASLVLHPLMGVFGISFCSVLILTRSARARDELSPSPSRLWPHRSPAGGTTVAALTPFGWILQKPPQAFLTALQTRHCYRLFDWTWYEWLGALGPLIIFWGIARLAAKQGQHPVSRFSTAVLLYSVFHLIFAIAILAPRPLTSLCTLEPMRFLQLVYIFMALTTGAYLGKYFLQTRAIRWVLFLLVVNGGMFIPQRRLFASTEHIEIPGMRSHNPWLQAFAWIRENTPQNAYFAVDPDYMSAPEEDYHGFRALTERSVLADNDKDTAAVTKAADLAPRWQREIRAQAGWRHFQLADFERLKTAFGTDWVLVSYPQPAGLLCPWHNNLLAVCTIPSDLRREHGRTLSASMK